MGIITAALIAGGVLSSLQGADWVILCCHLAMGGGTMAGGWRIIKTMGQRITKLTPFGGFSAETAGGLTLVMNAVFGIPVSTTHTITGRDRRRGRFASHHRGALGRDAAHRLGLGTDHSREPL